MYISYIVKQPLEKKPLEYYLEHLNDYAIPHRTAKIIRTTNVTEEAVKDKFQRNYINDNIKQRIINLAEEGKNIPEIYTTFKIPKASGGFRKIDAPSDQLNNYLKRVKDLFENSLNTLPHESAYAYVPGRCTKDAITVHQENGSRWFLKLDMKSFFTNCTKDFIYNSLTQVHPFSLLIERFNLGQELKTLISKAMLNGGLPQGTSLSPFLTNIAMVPIDFEINTALKNLNNKFVYTRYADDMLISSPYSFRFTDVVQIIQNILKIHNTKLKINKDKTRYGSIAGRNWNLGLMLNKDNNITVGYRNKELYRATLFTYLNDLKNGKDIDIIRTKELAGITSYYISIEPDYFNTLIKKYEKKFNINLKEIL